MMYNERKTPDILIRRLENRDIDAVLKAISEALDIYCKTAGILKSQIDAGRENIQTIQDMIASSFFYGVELKGQIIGTIRLTFPCASELLSSEIQRELKIGEKDLSCYISRFYVNPQFHGAGIGSRLIAFANDMAHNHKTIGLFLHSAVSNKDMLSFYQKRGFHLVFSENSRGYDRGLFYKQRVE